MSDCARITRARNEIDIVLPQLSFLSAAVDALSHTSDRDMDIGSHEWQGLGIILMDIHARLDKAGECLASTKTS